MLTQIVKHEWRNLRADRTLWAVAALVIVADAWFEARAAAAVLLLFFLPGWAWLEAWLPGFREGEVFYVGMAWRGWLASA